MSVSHFTYAADSTTGSSY